MSRPVALVTGASAGLGVEFAHQLAARGHDLVLVARRAGDLGTVAAAVQANNPVTCHILPADLSDPAAVTKLVEDIRSRNLAIDVLVNNAGFGQLGLFADADLARSLDMIRLNVSALVQLTGLLLPGMRERKRGRILNVASTAAFQPGPRMAIYYATKAFVLSFSEALSVELEGTGVTATCLCPGPTKTEFADVSGMNATNLFKGPTVATVGPVVRAGLNSLFAGRRRVVPGFSNKLLAFSNRVLPRGVILRIVERFQRGRQH